MKQTRFTSLMKSLVSTAVGFAVAFFANMLVLPWFGYVPTVAENLLLTTVYTVISIARGYVLERVFEALGWRQRISPFASAVLAERQRQITQEGWSAEHDDRHERGDLASAGACYAGCAGVNAHENRKPPGDWPWESEWWKPSGFRRDLVKAAALIVAEGEKFDRSRTYTRIVKPNLTLAHDKTRSEQGGSSA